MTSNSPANAASGSANADASAAGDVFAAILDQLAQDPTNGLTTVSADAVSASNTSAGAQDDAATTPAAPAACTTLPADPMLTELLAFQAATNTPAPTSTMPPAKPTDINNADADTDTASATATAVPPADAQASDAVSASPSTQSDAGSTREAPDTPITPAKADSSAQAKPTTREAVDTPVAPAKADASAPAKPTPRENLIRDPGQRPDDRISAKSPHHARAEAARPNDPSQDDPAQADPTQGVDADMAATSTVPVTDSPAQATTPAAPAIAADPASAEAIAAALPVTNQAASAVVAAGTITKPGKTTTGVASNDSSRTESRNTRASALADAGDVTKRGFASEPVVRASALPIQDKADDADKASNGATAQPPQHNAANPATAVTPAQQASAVEPAQVSASAAPVHASAASQPDPGVSITTVNTGASPTQTPSTPAHIAAQIQVSQHAPDVNALAVTIAAKSEDGQKHFDIRLDPAELGRVDVRLTVDDAGKAQAMLSVEKPQTLELLQKDQGHLERALKDAGLDLTQNGLSFSLKGQQQGQQGTQDHTPFARGQRLAAHAVAAVQDITPILSTSGISASDTRLDIRV